MNQAAIVKLIIIYSKIELKILLSKCMYFCDLMNIILSQIGVRLVTYVTKDKMKFFNLKLYFPLSYTSETLQKNYSVKDKILINLILTV